MKLFIAENGRAAYLSLIVLGFLMITVSFVGFLSPQTATVVSPETETVVENRDPVTVSTNVTTTAVVQNDVLWENGTRLVDNPVYLTSATPEFTITSRVTASPGTVRASQELVLVTQAVRDGDVFWEEEEVIEAADSTPTESGTLLEATIDARELNTQFKDIKNTLSGKGSLSTSLRLNVRYVTGKYEGEIERETGLSVDSETYTVGDGLDSSVRKSTPTQREVPKGTGYRIAAMLLGSVLLMSAMFVKRTRKEEYDIEKLRRELHKDKYREWISRAIIPDKYWTQEPDSSADTDISSELRPIQTDSLEDLVDIAIDNKKRVIHDEKKDVYVVMDGTSIYYYEPTVSVENTDDTDEESE